VKNSLNGKSRNTIKATTLATVAGAALVGRYVFNQMRTADISGSVVLITGGTSGLGYLLARAFGREGCRLVVCARDEDELRTVYEDLLGQGFDVLTLQCDVADRSQVDDMIQRATDRFGRIDILVNNAGVIQVGPADAMNHEDYESAMDIMFWGTVYPTLAVLPQMRERGAGRIVNITSIGGKVSVPHLLPYSAAKFAATGFSEGLHAELKKDGITVTTITPGLMRTGSYYNAMFKGKKEQEYALFSLSSSLPLITMDAERAARQILQAVKRGEAERILSIPANILARFHGLFPSKTNEIMALVDRFALPDPPDTGRPQQPEKGEKIEGRLHSSAQKTGTMLGRKAADRFQPADNLPEDETFSDPRD
jgi:short-subunit dehydrogenase